MTDIGFIFTATGATLAIFAVVRLCEIERARRRRLAESWRAEQLRREREDDADDTKTWPGPLAGGEA